MKMIRDPIHGEISFEDRYLPLLDSPRVQRLRRVKQIGLGNLVYPGANHTRFEHSVGTMDMAQELCTKMGFNESDSRKLVVASLLHDIGHGPLSHSSEKFLVNVSEMDHSQLTYRGIMQSQISEILSSMGMDPCEIAEVSSGRNTELGHLIHSQIGVDRMDYLMRDAHYTGVAYGVIDHERILSTLVYNGGEIMIREKGTQAAESLLVARFLMYPSVYLHHVSRIADAMLLRALEDVVEDGIAPQEIMKMDDLTLLSTLKRRQGIAGEMTRRILERDLFKRAIYLGPAEVEDLDDLLTLSTDREKIRSLEMEIEEEAGLPPGEVLVDIQERPRMEEMEIKVLSNSGVEALEERSTLVRTLREAQWNYWRFGVYCARERLESVRKVCEAYGWKVER